MSRIFLSHAWENRREAVALKKWLGEQDAQLEHEIFLAEDPRSGLAVGIPWKKGLFSATSRCHAIICLLSEFWAKSSECKTEYRTGEGLSKQILCARLESSEADVETAEWQRCDLFGEGPEVNVDIGDGAPVRFAERGLHQLLDGIRGAGISAQSYVWPPKGDPGRAPYRGWEPFQESDAGVFFGRDEQIIRALAQLRTMRNSLQENLFVMLGPSGTGKSSFLRAGLMPRLRRDDQHFLPLEVMRPERRALTGDRGLARSIYEARHRIGLNDPSWGEIKLLFADNTANTDARALLIELRDRAVARRPNTDADVPPPTVILPLDQAEELFNTGASDEAKALLELIRTLSNDVELSFIVATTIRTDRYDAMQNASDLKGVTSVLFDDLKPMPRTEFKDVISKPAERATEAGRPLHIDQALVGQLLREAMADADGGGDTLPLISLTLARLFSDYGAGGELTRAHYQAMGGMRRVVQTEIEKVLSDDPADRATELEHLKSAFIPWLADINPDNDQPQRRQARMSQLPEHSRPVIEKLIEKRLMIKDWRSAQGGEPAGELVEVAAESLLRQWEELAGWLRDHRDHLVKASGIERAARGWAADNEDSAWLLRGSRLEDAKMLAREPGFGARLEPIAGFLHASYERERKRLAAQKRNQQTLRALTVAMTLIAVVAFVAFIGANRAQQQSDRSVREAIALRLTAEAETILSGADFGGDQRAFQELLAGRTLAGQPDDEALLHAAAIKQSTLKIMDAGSLQRTVAFSPDGHLLAAGGADETVRLWDTTSGRPVGVPMVGHSSWVQSVAFTPDGRRLVSASDDGTVRFWDVGTNQESGPSVSATGEVKAVAFNPDGSRLATASSDGTVQLWDTETRRPAVPPLNAHAGQASSVVFSPDGLRLASAGDDKVIRLWDAATGQIVAVSTTADSNFVHEVQFSPDGRLLASVGGNGARLWDAATLNFVRGPLGGRDSLFGVAFSPDGQRLVAGGAENIVHIWDPATGRAHAPPLVGHTSAVNGVAVSADARVLASASGDHTIRLWDLDQILIGHTNTVESVAFSSGERIATGGDDDTVRQWHPATGQPTGANIADSADVFSVVYSPDGQRIATGSAAKDVRVWDAATGQPALPPLAGHSDAVRTVAFSPDGERIASGSADQTVRVWDAHTGRPVFPALTGHTDMVSAVAFSPDGQRLASVGADMSVRVWDITSGQLALGPLFGHTNIVTSVAFSPDGLVIASAAADNTVRLWNSDSGQPVGVPLTGHTGRISSLAFSPDGDNLVTGSSDRTVRLWDVATGTAVTRPFIGHSDTVLSVAFSSDGRNVASASNDMTVRLWPTAATAQDLCDKLNTNMSYKQWRDWVSPDIEYDRQCPDLPIASD